MVKVFVAVMLCATAAFAQMSPDEAMARLAAKQHNKPHPVAVIAPATKPAENPDLEAIAKETARIANRQLDQLNDMLTTAQLERTRAQLTSQITASLDSYSGQRVKLLLRTENVFDLGNGDYLAIGEIELPLPPAMLEQYRSLRVSIEENYASEQAEPAWMEASVRMAGAKWHHKMRLAQLEEKYAKVTPRGRAVVLGGEQLLSLQRQDTLAIPLATIDRIVLQGGIRRGFVDQEATRFEKEDRFYLSDMKVPADNRKIRCITGLTAYVAIGDVRKKIPNPPNEPAEKSAFEFSPENTAAIIR